MAKEAAEEKLKSTVIEHLQPWQAIFTVLTWVVTQFDITDWQTLVLIAMLCATLGFAMIKGYQHNEIVREVVAPWIVEKAIDLLSVYMKKVTPVPTDPSIEARVSILKKQIAVLETQKVPIPDVPEPKPVEVTH